MCYRRRTNGWEAIGQPALLLIMLLTMFGGLGCQSAPKAPTDDSAAAAYERGDYQQALQYGEAEARRASGVNRDEANYIAGLSAYRLGRNDEAVRLLNRVTGSGDRTLAAQAKATLGLIHASQRRDSTARRLLEDAADTLRGADLAQVHYHLGRIDQRAGRWAAARSHMSIALSLTNDPTMRKVIRQDMAADGFTLQFGAYSQRTLAEQRADELRRYARQLRTTYPRVVPSITEQGRTLYLVQMGHFTTEAQARQVMQRTRMRDVFIAPAQ